MLFPISARIRLMPCCIVLKSAISLVAKTNASSTRLFNNEALSISAPLFNLYASRERLLSRLRFTARLNCFFGTENITATISPLSPSACTTLQKYRKGKTNPLRPSVKRRVMALSPQSRSLFLREKADIVYIIRLLCKCTQNKNCL